MSTISLNHPDIVRVRFVSVHGMILVLSGMLMLTLVISASLALPAGREAVSQIATVPLAVPVPTPALTASISHPAESPAILVQETSRPSLVAVPAPMPPAPPSQP